MFVSNGYEKTCVYQNFPIWHPSSSGSLSSTNNAPEWPSQAGQKSCFFFEENAVFFFSKMAGLGPYIWAQELILISNSIFAFSLGATINLNCPYLFTSLRFISLFHHKCPTLQSNLSQVASQPIKHAYFLILNIVFWMSFEMAGSASPP